MVSFKEPKALKPKSLNASATRTFTLLTAGMHHLGGCRTIGKKGGCFMPVSVELLRRTAAGPVFAIAHYFEQNGDLMADPDMTFIVLADARIIPLTFQQDNLGVYHEAATANDNGMLAFTPVMQADITAFANSWMKNIKDQQLSAPTDQVDTVPVTSDLQAAIDRSRSHTEIVSVEYAGDEGDLLADLHTIYDGGIDSAVENNGSIDVWGRDWRLRVVLR